MRVEAPQIANTPKCHTLYSVQPDQNGRFYCPWFETSDCNHRPTTQRSTYHKCIDAHLIPYRCQENDCENQTFLSTSALSRHRREHLKQLFREDPGDDQDPNGRGFGRAQQHDDDNHNQPESIISPQSIVSPPPVSNDTALSAFTTASCDSTTPDYKAEVQRPGRKRATRACTACRRRRTRCQDARPCQPCVKRKLACQGPDSTTIQTKVDVETQTSPEDAASEDNEKLYDNSNNFDLNDLASPHTYGSRSVHTRSASTGLWQLKMCRGYGSPLLFEPGTKIATLSHGNQESCQPVQIALPNDAPMFQGRGYLEVRSTYEFSRHDNGVIHGAWRPDDGVKFGLGAESTASLPWMYEILSRCPGMFFNSYDGERERLFESVSYLHGLEFELARSGCFSAEISCLPAFQSYQTALYIQWRAQGRVTCEMTNPRFDKIRIETMCMIREWQHVVNFTHVRADGSLSHSSEFFSSFAELKKKGWGLRNNIVSQPSLWDNHCEGFGSAATSQ